MNHWPLVLVLAAAACAAPPDSPAYHDPASFAYTARPDQMAPGEFQLTVAGLEFRAASNPLSREAGRTIMPESHWFDPTRAPVGTSGRVVAKEIEANGTVRYWWMQASGTGDGISRWYDPAGREVAVGTWSYCNHGETRSVPDAAFGMPHDAGYTCGLDSGIAPLAVKPGLIHSSWVSCGGGCCNGAKH